MSSRNLLLRGITKNNYRANRNEAHWRAYLPRITLGVLDGLSMWMKEVYAPYQISEVAGIEKIVGVSEILFVAAEMIAGEVIYDRDKEGHVELLFNIDEGLSDVKLKNEVQCIAKELQKYSKICWTQKLNG